MALSDSCFDFMQATADAAEALAAAVHHYAAPDYPISYGTEIDALRRACVAVKQSPYDPKSGAELLRLAASVMTFQVNRYVGNLPATMPGVPDYTWSVRFGITSPSRVRDVKFTGDGLNFLYRVM